MHKPRLQRDEGFLIMRLTGRRQGGQRAPMERVRGSNHLVGSIPLPLAVFTGQFEGSFIGLSATIPKEHAIQTTVLDEQLRQQELRHRVELIGRLDQGGRLLSNGVGHNRMRVPQVVDRPAGNQI